MREIKPLIASIRNISLWKLREKKGALYLYILFDCLEQVCNTQCNLLHSTANGHHYGGIKKKKTKKLKNVSSITVNE